MFHSAVSSLFSHWLRHPGQLATLILGLAMATALWSGVQAINAEARNAYDRAAETLGQDRLSRLVRTDGQPVPLETYVALRRQGYDVSPVISGVFRAGDLRLRLLGIDPLTTPEGAEAPGLAGNPAMDLADFFGTPGVVLLGEGPDPAAFPAGFPRLEPSTSVPPGAGITDIATAARLLGRDDPTYLLIAPRQPAHLAPLPGDPALRVEGPQQGSDIGQLTDSFHLNLTAFGFLAFAVGLFIVHGAVGLSVEQRRGTVRSLRAMGVPLRTVLTAFALEMGALALCAALIGLILGYGIAAALMPGVAGTLRGLYGAEIGGSLRFDPIWAVAGAGMTLAGAGIAATQAFARLAAMPILQPANPRAWAVVSGRAIRRQGWSALGLGGVAVAVLWFGDGLVAGFAFLAAMLCAAALLLPVALMAGLAGLGRILTGVRIEWLLADTRQQVPSLSLALMALMLALAANVGVSTMVGSFRGTFTGWLDQRLASELYVTARDADEAAALAAYLAPRSDAILPITSADTVLAGQPGAVFGVADHATYRDHWPLLSAGAAAWDRLAAGDGVLVNEQLSRRANLALGDALLVAPGLTLPIVGVYSDYGNPSPQAIVGIDRFRATFPAVPVLRFAVRVPEGRVASTAADLREAFGLPDDAVVNQAQVKRFSLSVFDRTFQITAALNILTLSVAAFAILTSLLTLASMRLPQVAPVWAIGITRRALAGFDLARALLLAALTCLFAIPVGLLLAWALLAIVNVEAFGWRLPMQIFPHDWVGLGALALLAAGLAAAIPAVRLARMQPDRLLRVFANDR